MPLSRDWIDETIPTSHLGIRWRLTNRLGSYAIGAAVGIIRIAIDPWAGAML